MTEEFSHDQDDSQFEIAIDGTLAGVAHYMLSGGVADFDHTEVPPAFGGRGIAGRLVQYAMDEIRSAGEWKVRATCSYVARWFGQHPEYADLLV